jgi:hypothetical protein
VRRTPDAQSQGTPLHAGLRVAELRQKLLAMRHAPERRFKRASPKDIKVEDSRAALPL